MRQKLRALQLQWYMSFTPNNRNSERLERSTLDQICAHRVPPRHRQLVAEQTTIIPICVHTPSVLVCDNPVHTEQTYHKRRSKANALKNILVRLILRIGRCYCLNICILPNAPKYPLGWLRPSGTNKMFGVMWLNPPCRGFGSVLSPCTSVHYLDHLCCDLCHICSVFVVTSVLQ